MLFKTNTIIGHRGCSLVSQNNTVEAFLKAAEVGAEMVEMDIRKTRDGVLIIWHDSDVAGLRIRGSFYGELAALANTEGMILPMLEDVLKELAGKIFLDIELKEEGFEEEVVSMVLQYFAPHEFLIKSFSDISVSKIKAKFPTVKCGLLLNIRRNDLVRRRWGGLRHKINTIFPWRRVAHCGADFIAINWGLLAFNLAGRAQKRGIPVLVWTVNDEKMIRNILTSRQTNGLITDRPDLAIKIRNNL